MNSNAQNKTLNRETLNNKAFIKIKNFNRREYLNTLHFLQDNEINTVCLEANCPNRYECFSNKTATFMILGDTCTRNCKYCNIKHGIPKPLDSKEPKRIAEAVKKLNLNYAVITSVTRDDLKDHGAMQFARTVNSIHNLNPKCKIEILIPDFTEKELITIIKSKPNIINHNIEATKNVFDNVRPQGSYKKSLNLLKSIKRIAPNISSKSGLMLGFGESYDDIKQTLKDLKNANVDILTLGQYLQPTNQHYPVKKYYSEKEFLILKDYALNLGFKIVLSGILVRSSYHAKEVFDDKKRCKP